MPKHFHDELTELTKQVLHMGGLMEAALDRSLSALLDRDGNAAREVIDGDQHIDELELDIEEKCLDLLALHQPVAKDLRYITGILKINSDLERMADLAVNIAKRAEVLAEVPPLPFRPDISRLAAVVKQMAREGLDALVRRDVGVALRVWSRDDEADRLFRELIGQSIQFMRENPDRIGDTLHLTGALRNLERTADHATNIAEDVIFMAEGRIVRHHVMEFKKRRQERQEGAGEPSDEPVPGSP